MSNKFVAFLFAITIITSVPVDAQKFDNRDLQAIVDSERGFANLARKENTRKAFLTYLSDDAVVFDEGPVNGKQRWQDRPVDDSKLDWDPEFADVSASGDLGYTTGPWEYRAHRTEKNPSAHGHFISVWKKQPAGFFQNILDIGVNHPHDPESHPLKTAVIKAGVQRDYQLSSTIMDIEKKYLEAVSRQGFKAHVQALSRDARLYRSGKLPMTVPTVTRPVAEREGASISYSPLQSGIAGSGDLGYVYGTAHWTETKQGKKQEINANYARIWKFEADGTWRIVLEVVSRW